MTTPKRHNVRAAPPFRPARLLRRMGEGLNRC